MKQILVDRDVIVIRPDTVAEFMGRGPGGYRAAAKQFHTSASTLCRFMRKNGYRTISKVVRPKGVER